MALIPPFYSDAVVAIGYESSNRKIMWGASGFFYFHTLKGDKGRIYLITNKHVLDMSDHVYLRLNPKAMKEPRGYTLNLINPQTQKKLWIGHRNKHVDVAVIPVNFQLFERDEMQVSYFHDRNHTMDTSAMKIKGTSEGDGVFALGFPVSVVGDRSNSVIIRGGTIARIRDTFETPTEPFLIDTTVFPGNSGGPVVNKPEMISIEGTQAIQKANLIGIIASYVPYRDIAVSNQTGKARVIFEENSGLSNVFSIDCIESTVKRFERDIKKSITLAEPKKSEKALEKPET